MSTTRATRCPWSIANLLQAQPTSYKADLHQLHMRHGYHADPIRDGGCQRHHHPREPAPMRLDMITAHLNGAAQASSDDEDTGRFCGSKTWHHLRGEQRRGGRRRACCRRAAAHTKKRTRQECGNVRTESRDTILKRQLFANYPGVTSRRSRPYGRLGPFTPSIMSASSHNDPRGQRECEGHWTADITIIITLLVWFVLLCVRVCLGGLFIPRFLFRSVSSLYAFDGRDKMGWDGGQVGRHYVAGCMDIQCDRISTSDEVSYIC